jgi:6-pyruvoyltetrahydropterin/6-carboxytetrahydropterin synthase
MFAISKRFDFSASHVLDHLEPGHPCARMHGHNYKVEVVIESPTLDDRGFCQVDYRELDAFKAYIDDHLDHRHLNDVLPVPTTAENIARFLYGKAKELGPHVAAVRVSETDRTWAEYRGPA